MLESNIKMFKAESKESCVNILKSFPLIYVIIFPLLLMKIISFSTNYFSFRDQEAFRRSFESLKYCWHSLFRSSSHQTQLLKNQVSHEFVASFSKYQIQLQRAPRVVQRLLQLISIFRVSNPTITMRFSHLVGGTYTLAQTIKIIDYGYGHFCSSPLKLERAWSIRSRVGLGLWVSGSGFAI